MERIEDFCFEFKYLKSNRNQLRKKNAKEKKLVYNKQQHKSEF